MMTKSKKNTFLIVMVALAVLCAVVAGVAAYISNRNYIKAQIAAEVAVRQYEANEAAFRKTINDLFREKAELTAVADEQKESIAALESDRGVLKNRVAAANKKLADAKAIEDKMAACIKVNEEKDLLLDADDREITKLKGLVAVQDGLILQGEKICAEMEGRLNDCNKTLDQYTSAHKPKKVSFVEKAAIGTLAIVLTVTLVKVIVK
jgi:uncharacterized membrane protein